MKLDVKAFALTFGLLWGGSMLLIGIVNMTSGGYGRLFLVVMSSVYPGYTPTGSLGSAIVGALYGLMDGAVGGAVLAWLYNRLSE